MLEARGAAARQRARRQPAKSIRRVAEIVGEVVIPVAHELAEHPDARAPHIDAVVQLLRHGRGCNGDAGGGDAAAGGRTIIIAADVEMQRPGQGDAVQLIGRADRGPVQLLGVHGGDRDSAGGDRRICGGRSRRVGGIGAIESRRRCGLCAARGRLGRLFLRLDELALHLLHLVLQLLHLALDAVDLIQVECRRLGVGRTGGEYRGGREQPPMTFQHCKLSCSLTLMTPRSRLYEQTRAFGPANCVRWLCSSQSRRAGPYIELSGTRSVDP